VKVLFIAAEVAPLAKVGGLADVAGSLPKALRALGHDVRVAMPKHGSIDETRHHLQPVLDSFPVPTGEGDKEAFVMQGILGTGVPVYLVGNQEYFARPNVYGYDDDGRRYAFFSRAVLEMLSRLDWQPDVIHCHDWHTALIINMLKTIYAEDPSFAPIATVFTIHNLAYQGVFGADLLDFAGLTPYGLLSFPDSPEAWGGVNCLARGIYFADIINTVSPRYAQEILTPELGMGLDPLLCQRQDRLFGILNGLDYEVFNPATDPHIAACYDVNSLERRGENKLALQQESDLPVDGRIPFIGLISRLADQKGFDILAPAMDELLGLGVQFVLLGTGDPRYHEIFSHLGEQYRGRLAVFLKFDAALAQRIYAGTDMFLMPSRFEPCGLGQLIAMRYGNVPVVRATGGLADTVQNFDPATGQGNGFSFTDYTPAALLDAVRRALAIYREDKPTWRLLMERGMRADFSWNASARKYVELYHKARSQKV